MAERPFIYDPSQQVAKNIEGVNRSVQNAWQPLIENKIRDYESISKDLDNIDEIKRNLKGYHADILTSRLGTLQGDLAKTIEKNGTINVAARAKVKADIEQVKNLYIKSQQAGPMLEEMLSRIKDNSAHINDVAGTRANVIREFIDTKTMFSGQDLGDRLNDIYSKSLNVPSIGNARAYEQYKHVAKAKKNWTNPKTGDLETIEFKPIDGFVFDESTGDLVPDMARIKELSKSFFTTGEKYALKQIIGPGQALNANVEDASITLLKQALSGVAGFSRVISTSASKRIKDDAGADKALRENSPEFLAQKAEDRDLKRENTLSEIKNRGISAANSSASLGLRSQSNQREAERWEEEKNKPQTTQGSRGPVVRKTLSGNPIINMSIDDGDTKNAFNGVGVDKSGNFYLTKGTTVNGKKVSRVAKARQEDVDRVINDLPTNKLNAVKDLKDSQNDVPSQASPRKSR